MGLKNEHEFAAAYNPMHPKEPWNLSYIGKYSKRFSLFSELKGTLSPVPNTAYLAGFKLKFREGVVTGYGTSKFKLFA